MKITQRISSTTFGLILIFLTVGNAFSAQSEAEIDAENNANATLAAEILNAVEEMLPTLEEEERLGVQGGLLSAYLKWSGILPTAWEKIERYEAEIVKKWKSDSNSGLALTYQQLHTAAMKNNDYVRAFRYLEKLQKLDNFKLEMANGNWEHDWSLLDYFRVKIFLLWQLGQSEEAEKQEKWAFEKWGEIWNSYQFMILVQEGKYDEAKKYDVDGQLSDTKTPIMLKMINAAEKRDLATVETLAKEHETPLIAELRDKIQLLTFLEEGNYENAKKITEIENDTGKCLYLQSKKIMMETMMSDFLLENGKFAEYEAWAESQTNQIRKLVLLRNLAHAFAENRQIEEGKRVLRKVKAVSIDELLPPISEEEKKDKSKARTYFCDRYIWVFEIAYIEILLGKMEDARKSLTQTEEILKEIQKIAPETRRFFNELNEEIHVCFSYYSGDFEAVKKSLESQDLQPLKEGIIITRIMENSRNCTDSQLKSGMEIAERLTSSKKEYALTLLEWAKCLKKTKISLDGFLKEEKYSMFKLTY
ncbi:MAG: hypothetical protein Q4C70_06300 [Planctomycetia bacterium]|nr:hypothetical protein [Planctomycetia bacterium]